MAKEEDYPFQQEDSKAGYNTSYGITQFLLNLLGGYLESKQQKQYDQSLIAIKQILDIISAKAKEEDIKEADELINKIEHYMPEAMQKYTNKSNGLVYLVNPGLNKQLEQDLTLLFRYVNKLQDKYGYGMVSQDDPRMAVLQR